MFPFSPRFNLSLPVLLLALLLAACAQPTPISPTPQATALPPPLSPSPEATALPSPLPLSPTPPLSLSPTPSPRSLTICMGAEPETLYIYGNRMLAQQNIFAAIYDGPIDTNSFGYQPVILEKIPSLADGDAVIQPVTVQENDLIVNDAGEVTLLAVGQVVRPYGCNHADCAITWDGNTLEMAQLSVTFTLLEGLQWSDGESLTAADSVFSFNIALNPDTPVDKTTLHRVASYTALDERTVQWVGRPGFLDPAYQTNFFHPLPAHQLRGMSAAELLQAPETDHMPLGWGPYMIENWQPGDRITLARNPYYFRLAEGLPRFDRLTFRFFGDNLPAGLAAIMSGECDLLDQEVVKAYDLDQGALDLQLAGLVSLHIGTGTTWEHVDFNIRPLPGAGFAAWDTDGDGLGPFGDVRLRQAVAMCMDRQAVVNTLFSGQSIVLNSYLPPEHPLYNPNVSVWPFDPTAAAALLDEIGWLDADGDPATPRIASGVTGVPDGTPLEFAFETTEATLRQQTTQILAESLAQCGIKANLVYYPASEWFADGPDGKLLGRKFDLGQFAWLTGVRPACELFMSDQIPGPEDQINPATGQNYLGWGVQNETGYSNPEYDAFCLTALSALPGSSEYADNHALAQEVLARDLPTIPLYLRIKWTVTRPDFCGHAMDPTSQGDFWNIEAYGIGADCP